MAGRWSDPSAFRADPAAPPAVRASRRQTVALLTVLVVIAGAVALASYVVRPEKARAFRLFHGSVFIAAEQSPVAVDLASGKPTLRLVGAAKQVGITGGESLGVVPLDGGTLLLNRRTGEFNMVDSSGFVIKHDGGGVPLGKVTGETSAIGVASGALAYVVRNSEHRVEVFLVSQATVAAAVSATGAVQPRASTALARTTVETAPGGAVAADRALWVLTDTGVGSHAIRRLTYPDNSNAGARLTIRSFGNVSGPAALATAVNDAGATVAVASADTIEVFGKKDKPVPFVAPQGLKTILPATNTSDRFAFLLESDAGWAVVSVRADGSQLRSPVALSGLASGLRLAQPAYSGGALYTMDQDSGRLFRIGLDGRVDALGKYPLAMKDGVAVEQASMVDGYVLARGSRVIFNSGNHANALIVFTDGSHPPLTIEKSSAVQVSAAGGAEQLTKSTVAGPQQQTTKPSKDGTKPQRPNAAPVVNPHLDCKNVSQKPHIPTIGPIDAGSRSAVVHWNYPIIDPTQDCLPTTYVLEINRVTVNAPNPPQTSWRVQGQTAWPITGLFPNTLYRTRVTAYIRGQGTPSDWMPLRTGEEGPAAPTGLSVAADPSGGWLLKWDSCGSVQNGCVPAQTWTVTPSFCDGRGLSGPPDPMSAPADPTARQQPVFHYPGSDALLGRGLQFIVTGSGQTQIEGRPSGTSHCVYSWSPPDTSAMTLVASKPNNSSLGGTTATTVRLDLGARPVHSLGGVGAKITFTVSGGGGPDRTKSVTWDGAGSSLTEVFDGLQPGVEYRASVQVSPPGHPEATATIGPQVVTAAADWPQLGLSANCQPEGSVIQLSCAFSAQISGISSGSVGGERFDIVNTSDTLSGLRCGNSFDDLTRNGIDPAAPITDDLSLFRFNGNCTVTLVLREEGSIFGGALKSVSTSLTIGPPSSYDAKSDDWDQNWDTKNGASVAHINYTRSSPSTGQLDQITKNWNVTILDPDGNACGNWSADQPPDGVDVAASGSCIRRAGDRTGWSVEITYQDRSDGSPHTVPGNHTLAGTPPTFQPCNPTGFSAAWGATRADGVTVTFGGDPGQAAGCSAFTYALLKDGTDCGDFSADAPPASTVIQPSCDLDSPGTWTVHIAWQNDNTGNGDALSPDIVLGDPPGQ